MQINTKKEQEENEANPSAESEPPVSNPIREIVLQLSKQPRSMTSILGGITTSSPTPKYRIADVSPAFIKNDPQKWKKQLLRSITIASIPDPASESPLSCERCSGT
jgi:hypothetical protein